MAWDDGRDRLPEIIKRNNEYAEKAQFDKIEYTCEEWSSPDGLTWSTIDDNGTIQIYNPEGEDYEGLNINDDFDDWYTENFEKIVDKYSGKIIAIDNFKIIAEGSDEHEIKKKLKEIHISYQYGATIIHVPKKEDLEECKV